MVGACRLPSLWLGTGERTGDHDVGVNGCGVWARVPHWRLVPWGRERVLSGVPDGSGERWGWVRGGEWIVGRGRGESRESSIV